MRDELDRYYTPDRLARACVYAVLDELGREAKTIRAVEDLHVGGGAWLRAWPDGPEKIGSDLDPHAAGVLDFGAYVAPVDALALPKTSTPRLDRITIGNPPYRNVEAHIRVALSRSRWAAYLLRLSILESKGRAKMWDEHPPRKVWALAQRPSFTGGATDSTGYALVLWDHLWCGQSVIVPGWDWHAIGGAQ